SNKIEVGSWAIGYWRPTLHFEINVWNCFMNKANKLLNSLKSIDNNPHVSISKSLEDIFDSSSNLLLILGDTKSEIQKFRDNSINLIITDPPHGDRIPYLELSSMWNAILNVEPLYSNEIVVSNAKERSKNLKLYNETMEDVITQLFRVLKPDGILALIFNATDIKYWDFLLIASDNDNSVSFIGCFPMNYSASSIVQDNRSGALKQDYVLIYIKCPTTNVESIINDLSSIPGWSKSYPVIRS
ncbi:MAG: type II modification methylase, partial [Candidatus Cloacimonetes bacterium]|nr:type II modification methylase [Candidatus Cloacimonadota bacterium]